MKSLKTILIAVATIALFATSAQADMECDQILLPQECDETIICFWNHEINVCEYQFSYDDSKNYDECEVFTNQRACLRNLDCIWIDNDGCIKPW